MYINLKPNKHKRLSFNTTAMASLGFIEPPNILGPPLNLALDVMALCPLKNALESQCCGLFVSVS